MTKTLDLNCISKYRLELMGISTLMILLCHAPAHIHNMPHLLSAALAACAYGVDLFLFLSGMGLWYSLSKIDIKKGLLHWYRKRYIRLLLPCLIVQVLFITKQDFLHHVLFFTGVFFFTKGDGFWFVDMLIPLYFITPALFLLSKKRYGLYALGFIAILCFCFCMIMSENPIIWHTKQVMTRVPSFLMGIMMAKGIKECRSVNTIFVTFVAFVVLPIMAFIAKRYISQDIMAAPFFVPMLLLVLCVILNLTNSMGGAIWRFLGKISLESYLLNVSISFILDGLLSGIIPNYAIYSITVVLGVIIAYVINRITQPIYKVIS